MSYFSLGSIGTNPVVFFGSTPIPSSFSPIYDIFRDLDIEKQRFVDGANALFSRIGVRIPSDYPKAVEKKWKGLGQSYAFSSWNEFTECIAFCLLLEDRYDLDCSKIIKKELIKTNSRSGILHAASLAALAYHFSAAGAGVEIVPESNDTKTPDLRIDGLGCELKVIEESDWTEGMNLETGQGKKRRLSEDICYDLGRFISGKSKGHKAIKQADVVMADLSRKSLGWLWNMNLVHQDRHGLPELKKHRVIYFARRLKEFIAYHIDVDPCLWELVSTCERTHRFCILPPPSPETNKPG